MFTLYCHSVLSEISFHGRVQFDNLQFDVCPNNENQAFAGQFLNYFLSKKYEGVIIKGQDRSACSEENVLFKFYFDLNYEHRSQVMKMQERNIKSTLDKFPSLERLAFCDKQLPSSWPKMVPLGNMVTELYFAKCFISSKSFDGIDMSASLPNLKTFCISVLSLIMEVLIFFKKL